MKPGSEEWFRAEAEKLALEVGVFPRGKAPLFATLRRVWNEGAAQAEAARVEIQSRHTALMGEADRRYDELLEQQSAQLSALRAALEKTVWRDRDQFPTDPYCVLCGAGQAWASKHGHQTGCALND